jgi:hypothetical protein
MSRHYTDSWRPANNNPKSSYQASSYQNNSYQPSSNYKKRRPQTDWQTKNHRADDQIAPSHTSHSVASLQRWALATAHLPQRSPRANESQIIERIERRYASEGVNRNEVRIDMDVVYVRRILTSAAVSKVQERACTCW